MKKSISLFIGLLLCGLLLMGCDPPGTEGDSGKGRQETSASAENQADALLNIEDADKTSLEKEFPPSPDEYLKKL